MNRALHPIADAKNIGYLSGSLDLATTRPTHAIALVARPINLLRQGCECFSAGTCPTCRAYASVIERNELRKVQ
jgi:hypothetical protein